MISDVIRIQATIQASRNGSPRTNGVARLTKNGPTMRARNGMTASHRMTGMRALLRTRHPKVEFGWTRKVPASGHTKTVILRARDFVARKCARPPQDDGCVCCQKLGIICQEPAPANRPRV